jgi:hypothetical protein
MLAQAQARVSDVAENTHEWVSETAGRAQQTAKDATETVTQQVHATSEAVRENVNSAAEQARIKAAQTRRRAKRSFWQTMEENPLAIGAAAAAAGALIGMALPSTEKENELMGETRDRLVEDASTSVQETMRKVQTVAEKVAQTATEKVQEEGVDQQNLPTSTTLQSMKGHETQSIKASTSA